MPSLSSTAAVMIIALGLAGVWGQKAADRAAARDPVLPVAALAWAQANCDPALAVLPGTPRVQAEDLIRIAAGFDAERTTHGSARACWLAQRAAASVTKHDERSVAMQLYSILASAH